MFWGFCPKACGISAPCTGRSSLNHWTTRSQQLQNLISGAQRDCCSLSGIYLPASHTARKLSPGRGSGWIQESPLVSLCIKDISPAQRMFSEFRQPFCIFCPVCVRACVRKEGGTMVLQNDPQATWKILVQIYFLYQVTALLEQDLLQSVNDSSPVPSFSQSLQL